VFRYLEIGREMGWGTRQRQERTTSPTPDYPTTTATVATATATATATTSDDKTTATAATNRLGNDEGRRDDRGANGGEPRRPEGLISGKRVQGYIY